MQFSLCAHFKKPGFFYSKSVCYQQLENPLKNLNEEILTDFTDGLICKSHNHFTEKNFINILLYQDSFEIVNPLGSAKKKHKIFAVYYTLGNLCILGIDQK